MVADVASIDPTAIPEVFRRLGLTPRRRVTFDRYGTPETPCGCIATALYLDDAGLAVEPALEQHLEHRNVGDAAFRAADGRYGREFVGGLIAGWDGARSGLSPEKLKQKTDWKRGYLVGRAAWGECVKAGLTKEDS